MKVPLAIQLTYLAGTTRMLCDWTELAGRPLLLAAAVGMWLACTCATVSSLEKLIPAAGMLHCFVDTSFGLYSIYIKIFIPYQINNIEG